LQFASLGSGSRGNATLVQTGSTTLMIDCGFSLRETEQRLTAFGTRAQDVAAILVTHEHSDHIKGVGAFARKYNTPVWLTYGTAQSARLGVLPKAEHIVIENDFRVGDITVTPFSVPHDASEPCQYRFSDGQRMLGLLTDTGMITPHIIDMLSGITGLLLECNHDQAMLMESDYPDSLKLRVAGNYGHLNNRQAADLLSNMDTSQLTYIAGMHLSENNNTPQLVKEALSEVLAWQTGQINVAHQDLGLSWTRIN
jgi:phosphoribosyl 1,2-cyclic phosphodiesterase